MTQSLSETTITLRALAAGLNTQHERAYYDPSDYVPETISLAATNVQSVLLYQRIGAVRRASWLFTSDEHLGSRGLFC